MKHVVGRSKQLVVSWDGGIKTCDRSSGRTRHIEMDHPFGPPARSISVAGNLVGFAEEVENDGSMPNYSVVRIADLRHNKRLEDGFMQRWGLYVLLPHDYPVKIGSMSIDTHRRVAWIECPEANSQANGNARPNCVHRGDRDSVQLLASPSDIKPGTNAVANPVQLASGTDIDPRSVRLTSTRVAWTQGGQEHSRSLPPLR